MEPRIAVDRVWKRFHRGERHTSLRDLIPAAAKRLAGVGARSDLGGEEFWAVKDVSFAVHGGEALGIVGPNGAGKSTILKLLTKILKPTRGRCHIRGRAGALIEVAAGFHYDLTGRENVYLQGAIIGMPRAEVGRKFDEIVEFAGLAEFIDTPVKRYSSGMQARLGFSIAAHLDPAVLLIDEVLAVGDLTFQRCCIERMQQFKQTGVAIVFVSHNLSAVAGLCDRVLVLRGGEVQTLARTEEGLASYARMTIRSGAPEGEPQAGEAFVEVRDAGDEPVHTVSAGDEMAIRAVVTVPRRVDALSSAVRIRRLDTGEEVFFTTGRAVGCAPLAVGSADIVEFRWRCRANFGRGHYAVEVLLLTQEARRVLLRFESAATFSVRENQSVRAAVFLDVGCAARVLAPQIERPASDSLNEPCDTQPSSLAR